MFDINNTKKHDKNILFLYKSKFHMKSKSYDNYSIRNLKQQTNGHEEVSVITCHNFNQLHKTSLAMISY